MKAHIGVDAETGMVHKTTPANAHDITDSGFSTVRSGACGQMRGIRGWRSDRRTEECGRVASGNEAERAHLDPESGQAQGEKRKASIRAKVEHPFLYVKRHFGYAKVRYRGLYKKFAATGYAVWAGESAEGGAFLGGGMMGSSEPMGECG